MAQAKVRKPKTRWWTAYAARIGQEVGLFALAVAAIYLLLSLFSYHYADPAWSYATSDRRIANMGGVVGAWFADLALYLLGYFAFVLPLSLVYFGWMALHRAPGAERPDWPFWLLRATGLLLFLLAGSALAAMHFGVNAGQMPTHSAGGIWGDVIAGVMMDMFSFLGATLLLLAAFLIGVTFTTGFSWLALIDGLGRVVTVGAVFLSHRFARLIAMVTARLRKGASNWQRRRGGRRELAHSRKQRQAAVNAKREQVVRDTAPHIEPITGTLTPGTRAQREKQLPLMPQLAPAASPYPALSLLDDPKPQDTGYSLEALQAMAKQVEIKLLDFGVQGSVQGIQPGPVITRFELQPAPGIKASKISGLAKDLARSLSVISVRVVEVIPGKSCIGLEIPNAHREMIFLAELLRSAEFEASTFPLPMALGKDIGGKPVVVNMAKMPHLLVAGTTGSGKSVGLNAMILSLLYRCSADTLRLIMIDPKMLELSVYEGIPQLLAPVVTDMKEAANALRWSVAEMERRYQLMAAVGVRNVAGYNKKISDAIARGEPMADPLYDAARHHDPSAPAPTLEPMPLIVVIVDEFADMIMVVGKKVEELIARLAQKARAAGIHLILATQRPSVDVITGLIKANIPSRIAFQVSSRVDSRTILDQMGAEHLLGHGDMLYLPPGTSVPTRIHGAFVEDHEVHAVAEYLRASGTPKYVDGLLDGAASEDGATAPAADSTSGGEDDPLYDQAVALVTQTRKASISGVQRRLKIGYNRAARLVEAMEIAGVVGPQQSNGNREVIAPPPVKP